MMKPHLQPNLLGTPWCDFCAIELREIDREAFLLSRTSLGRLQVSSLADIFHFSFFCMRVFQFACGTETRPIPTLFSILMVGDAQSPFIHPSVPSSPGRKRGGRGVVSFHDAPYAIIIPADDRVRAYGKGEQSCVACTTHSSMFNGSA